MIRNLTIMKVQFLATQKNLNWTYIWKNQDLTVSNMQNWMFSLGGNRMTIGFLSSP
jgi:hypothetical protein